MLQDVWVSAVENAAAQVERLLFGKVVQIHLRGLQSTASPAIVVVFIWVVVVIHCIGITCVLCFWHWQKETQARSGQFAGRSTLHSNEGSVADISQVLGPQPFAFKAAAMPSQLDLPSPSNIWVVSLKKTGFSMSA